MRLCILPAVLVGFLVGCNKSPEGGAPGTNATFKLSLPSELAMAKPIKKPTSESFDGSVERKGEFKKDVKLKVEAPEGKIEVKLSKDTIKASEGDTKFSIIVQTTKDTPVGDHVIKVTATPAEGEPTSDTFKVKVTD